MTFNLPIPNDIKDGLKFLYLGEAILDEKPPLEPESDKSIIDAIIVDEYEGDEIESMLGIIDEDLLVHTAWLII